MLPSNCAVCGSKKLGFIKGQQATRSLSSLGIGTSLSQIPLVKLLYSNSLFKGY